MSGSASYHWASPSVYAPLQTFPLPTIPPSSFASNKCKLGLLPRSIGADAKCFILLNFYLNCCQRLALYLNYLFDLGEHFQTKRPLSMFHFHQNASVTILQYTLVSNHMSHLQFFNVLVTTQWVLLRHHYRPGTHFLTFPEVNWAQCHSVTTQLMHRMQPRNKCYNLMQELSWRSIPPSQEKLVWNVNIVPIRCRGSRDGEGGLTARQVHNWMKKRRLQGELSFS